MKSIKDELVITFGLLILFVCIGFGFCSFYISSENIMSNVGYSLEQNAKQASETIESRLKSRLDTLETLALEEKISNPNIG